MNFDVVAAVPLFCDVLLGHTEIEGGIALPDQLERSLLNFGRDSLQALDRYLLELHQSHWGRPGSHDHEAERAYRNTIFAAGSYLGEVIRQNALRDYTWMNYEEYFPDFPELAEQIPQGLTSSAVLVSCGTDVTLPFARVARTIADGPDYITHPYALSEITSIPHC